MRRAGSRTAAAALAGGLLCGGLLSGCGGSGDNNASVQQPVPVAAGADAAAAAPAADAAAGAVTSSGAGLASSGSAATAAAPTSAKAARKADPLQAKLNGLASNNAAVQAPAPVKTGKGSRSAVPNTALAGRDIIYTADMTVRVDDVGKAATKVESAALAAGGLVVGSQRTSEPGTASASGPETVGPDKVGTGKAVPDRSEATLTLRVPPAEFDNVLTRIGGAGEVLDRTLTGRDVTAEVTDVTSRIDSQRKSVARIRDLMDRASTLKDIVSLESEVAQREADLDALLAKQAVLRDQSSLATITVHLLTKEAPVVVPTHTQDVGFGAGLHNGWDAFTGALTVAATVLGALLPFVVTLLVLGPPIAWFVVRLRRMAAIPKPNSDGPA